MFADHLGSLGLNAAGQVELRLNTQRCVGVTHLAIGPLEFVQRPAALVPRPRLRLIWYYDVLAPTAKLRPLVVPQGPQVLGIIAAMIERTVPKADPGRIRASTAPGALGADFDGKPQPLQHPLITLRRPRDVEPLGLHAGLQRTVDVARLVVDHQAQADEPGRDSTQDPASSS